MNQDYQVINISSTIIDRILMVTLLEKISIVVAMEVKVMAEDELNKPTWQVCGKYNHFPLICYNRYNKEFVGNPNQSKGSQNSNESGNQSPISFVTT